MIFIECFCCYSRSSIQLRAIRTFWSIRTFFFNHTRKFKNLNTNSLRTIFNQKCPNTPKCRNTPQLYTTDGLFNKMFQHFYIVYYQLTLWQNVLIHLYLLYNTDTNFYNSSINIRSISFFTIFWDAKLQTLVLH